MKNIAVLLVDQTKAKFFVLRPAERPREQWSPILEAKDNLINAHWYDQENESLAGGNRFSYHVGVSGMAQTQHGYDDHLSRHQMEISKRFAREVRDHLKKFVASHKPHELVIVADNKVLGELREQLDDDLKQRMQVSEVGMNLGHLSAVALHEHLSKVGALPQRMPPANIQNESYVRTGQWRRRRTPSEGEERVSET